MPKKELITVVIPVYNTEKYLDKCIKSVLKQTYKRLEIILIDDGSTDNSPSICDYYEKKDNRIKTVHLNNSGVSSARNTGIKLSKGEYITFIDSDDFINEKYIEYLLLNMEKNTLNICLYKYFFKDMEEITVDDEYNVTKIEKNDFIKLSEYDLLNAPVCKLYNNEIIKKNNIRFNEKLSLGEDLLFNYDYMNYIDFINLKHTYLYYYRKMDTNTLSGKYFNNMREIQLLLLDKTTLFFKNINNNKLLNCFRMQMIMTIVENEFRSNNKFIKKYIKARHILADKQIKKMIKDNKNGFDRIKYFMLIHNMYLTFKICVCIKKIFKKIYK